MDLFYNAKIVRLRSHHDKYLTAEEDEESVFQDRNGSSRKAKWVVEFIQTSTNNAPSAIRLKSCYGKYLTASNLPFLLGVKGRKVVQTLPRRVDDSLVEWVPIKDGSHVRLMTRVGTFLRANGGLPPWRNSVTHDVPYRTSTQEWIVWDVDILDIVDYDFSVDSKLDEPKPKLKSESKLISRYHPAHRMGNVGHFDSFGLDVSYVSNGLDNKFQSQESTDLGTYTPPKHDGRQIFYRVANDYGGFDENMAESWFTFKGQNVIDLTHKLEKETRLKDIFVCMRSPLNGKLYPLRLHLPPNTSTMHIVVVPSISTLAQDFS